MWPAVISAAGSLASSFMSKRSTEKASNSSWQRGVRDMRKAGLNPLLAFDKGGASTPSFQLQNPAGDVPEYTNSARRVKIEKDLAAAQAENLRSQADAARENALTNRMDVTLKQNEFNRDAPRIAGQNQLLEIQRLLGLGSVGLQGGVKQLQGWELKGAEADFEKRQFDQKQWEAINRTIEKLAGTGTTADVLRIVIQMLQSNFGGNVMRGMRRRVPARAGEREWTNDQR